ncbi:hypothetical protein QIS99_30385 [Streptomyces sp. B-S-A8]|uniref:Uncharacterized protein n=1 Tax=Streptomyces solicavernae TaxID=3043614 RepID=A0ABT6S196_9ACTN|nr:hypothetical protein [Streptomyces sp. B-S-A8]MDI3390469.1 hypothetical protein [Streptomyces sp. B-S-A8]
MSTDTSETEQQAQAGPDRPVLSRFRLPYVFRWPWVTRATARQLDREADALSAEAEHWFGRWASDSDRADRAEQRKRGLLTETGGLTGKVERLTEALDDTARERDHFERSHRAVCEERDEIRQTVLHLQQAGRDLVRAFTADDQAAKPMLDQIGQILMRHAHRFDLGREDLADLPWAPEPETAAEAVVREAPADLIRAAYRYPHDATEPALIGDHLPHCEACTAALGTLPDAVLVEACRAAFSYGKREAMTVIGTELGRRGIPAGTEQEATR